jgi:hypothetical protein
MSNIKHVRTRWPDPEVPAGSPEWLLYELDQRADAVTRTVEFFRDGAITRNSIEIEERRGKPCPSLIDVSLAEGFTGVDLEPITSEEFEGAWARGKDTPFWDVRQP